MPSVRAIGDCGVEMRDPEVKPAPARRLDRSLFDLEVPHEPPGTDDERVLAGIWEEVLDVSGLGVNDDFFLIGGDSFLAVTLFGEIERAFGRAPPLSTLLDCPTIRQLAARLGRPAAEDGRSPLIAIRRAGSLPPLFLAHAIEGDVLFAHRILPHLDPAQPLYAIRARGLEGEEEPHASFEAMAADFVTLIREVRPRGPYFLAGYCAGSLTALEMARRLRAAGERVGFVGLIDPNTHPNAAPWLYWRNPDTAPVLFLRRAIALRERGRLSARSLTGRPRPPGLAPERLPGESEDRFRRREALWSGITAALACYRPRPYEGSVAIFGSSQRISHLARRRPGWGALAERHEVFSFDCSHLELFDQALPQLGGALRRALADARAQDEAARRPA